MFGSATPGKDDGSVVDTDSVKAGTLSIPETNNDMSRKDNGGNGSPIDAKKNAEPESPATEKKRRSSSVAKARDIFSSARQSLHLHGSSPTSASGEKLAQSPMQKLSKQDPALGVPQGSLNNSAGESIPGPKSTFRVGVTEDKNKKCRRTMEDTHAYLYNFLSTPAPALGDDNSSKGRHSTDSGHGSNDVAVVETDNGYFAIFDGHAGTFAADWCGKKLHLLLEDTIRKNPNTPIPELLDQTFTLVDQQLEKLPLKNSGCTAVIAVLRWEDRVPNNQSATGSALLAPIAAAATKAAETSDTTPTADTAQNATTNESAPEKLKESASRQRVLYTANVGDARIVLCRNGRALRLSYDHKGSDENEGRRVANAGGLILNNRVNGVLAVTRALGDAYMKDLVTGHPYTTETVIQPEQDEFLILACDGLWDVCSDQEAVDLVRNEQDPQTASKRLVEHALARFSTDNLSCMIVRFDNKALSQRRAEHAIGVEGDKGMKDGVSEAEHIVAETRRVLDDTGKVPAEGIPPVNRGSEDMIVEEKEGDEKDQEGGPELNEEALKTAREKAGANKEGEKS
ncbi:PP2C-domain-containing protein [Rhizodiscina lignyota]|uniref:PP2C-domain-containing protein n=1 Tax=Rhizodiscina lignyota TaxID=1504668 RepID=A0A9P4MCT0_9PEZI|nr:PP2C-domain-containing protein [Rhizodiscina lignyota]